MIITHFFLQDVDYQSLINGFDFGANHPPFATIGTKHYIGVDNWSLWVGSKPNHDYVLATFPEFATIADFVDSKFESLSQQEYETHKADLSTDHEAFIEKEWELCEIVLKEMGTRLQTLIAESTVTQVQGLQLQELFTKQAAMVFPALGGITLYVPITEYLGQTRSLGAALIRLQETPIDLSIGFTQELKDEFIDLINKHITALNV